TASGGADGSGNYARKHNPAMTFTEINSNPTACARHITDLSAFTPTAADFSLIVPNLCHDMHDCSVKTGDDWLSSWLPLNILNTPTWETGRNAIFITWDEGDSNKRGGGMVPLIVLSSATPANTRSTQPYNHYSLLRTIEASWGLRCLNHSCETTPMNGLFPSPLSR
ncbi:MAG TPA: alkaline phosphatase family protein, partial [Thermomicrobiaceae bacterium]|nr:alkaline phosphatase family protein [Thermomicrobiaceae bacterium]